MQHASVPATTMELAPVQLACQATLQYYRICIHLYLTLEECIFPCHNLERHHAQVVHIARRLQMTCGEVLKSMYPIVPPI